MSSSVGAGAFLQGLAGGVGLGMQAQNMKQQNSNKPSNGLAYGVAQGQAEMSKNIANSDTGLMNIGGIGLPDSISPQSSKPSNNVGGSMWGSLMKLVGG